MSQPIYDVNIRKVEPMVPADRVISQYPITAKAMETVTRGREQIKAILDGRDSRYMVIVGPCSIHDERLAEEYASRLAPLAGRLSDRMLIVMRVYFEKPRTTVGWKGLINDPHLDGSYDIATGLATARRILSRVSELGLPAGTEFLDPFIPQYVADLVSWAAIGARTTESQTHRQMASGLSMPVGFKNGTDGNTQIAVDAMLAARAPHAFLGIDREGHACVIHTNGNPAAHVVLRGGSKGTNYSADAIEQVQKQLAKAGLSQRVMVDCSHANSEKDHAKQAIPFREVLEQRLRGNENVVGVMLESNLVAGRQDLKGDPKTLKYGVSITDACIGWEETEHLLTEAYKALEPATASAG
ncbi:MAG: 3-deoxy-7-phosphoheptulonate synthase [SAR202 cluster bacterium]|nr:3-deoxy-7-phosphoheptulonate synthase [SAR202 cluster bacterium]